MNYLLYNRSNPPKDCWSLQHRFPRQSAINNVTSTSYTHSAGSFDRRTSMRPDFNSLSSSSSATFTPPAFGPFAVGSFDRCVLIHLDLDSPAFSFSSTSLNSPEPSHRFDCYASMRSAFYSPPTTPLPITP